MSPGLPRMTLSIKPGVAGHLALRLKGRMTNREHNLTKHWRALDAAHHIHPFSDTAALNKEGVRVITRADGVYLWDSEGNKILDGMSGLWCVQQGYGNRELAEAGYEALRTLPITTTSSRPRTPYTIELAASWRRSCPTGMSACCSPIPDRRRTIPR